MPVDCLSRRRIKAALQACKVIETAAGAGPKNFTAHAIKSTAVANSSNCDLSRTLLYGGEIVFAAARSVMRLVNS